MIFKCMVKYGLWIVFLVLCNTLLALPEPSPYKIARITSPVKLDGKSDEPVWQKIKPFPLTVMSPDFGADP